MYKMSKKKPKFHSGKIFFAAIFALVTFCLGIFIVHRYKTMPCFLCCAYTNTSISFDDDYAPLVELLKVYDGFDKSGTPLTIRRHGSKFDGGYAVPELAFLEADALMGYGIADDISFEEKFSDLYKKPSFGFDCGVTNINIKNKLCKFIPQCIGSDKTIYNSQISSGKISSYFNQLKALNLETKKIFLKMDIEGAEYDAIKDILLQEPKNITGIVVEIHMWNKDLVKEAIKTLEALNKDFVLVHVHVIKYCGTKYIKTSNITGIISNQIELSYINKNLLSKYKLSKSQKHPTNIDYPNFEDHGDVFWEIK